MKARLHPFACLVVASISLAAAFAWPLPAHADDEQRIRQLQRSGEILSLEHIFDRARKIKPGRIVDVDLDKDDGRYTYEIELLQSNGQVWEMEFDARTGELLQLEQDD